MHHRLSQALRLSLALLATFSSSLATFSQRPPAQPHAAEILHKMQKLNVLGSVLYIVAHPDDENTRLIAWLANGKKVRTGNLSLTRGDGGQNLIGPELGDALGIIRTQELMEARRIDGGEQFFTRAVDFGYSKSAAESFEKWGKQEVLSDVVRVIRMFRPDVIITRFAPDRSAGHGHHEASAILAEEAFDLAGDPTAFPEQLEQGLEVWQPRRLFFNGSTWWKKDLADIAKSDPDWFSVDVGGYDPLLGLSYTEIAGRSRSMHKSQGFGAAETRGESLEYLKLIKGDRPKTEDIFEGIDMTWGRVKGGDIVQNGVTEVIKTYDPLQPSRSADGLWKVKHAVDSLKFWVHTKPVNYHALHWDISKSKSIEELLLSVAGLVFEVTCPQGHVASGDSLPLTMTMLPREEFKGKAMAHLSVGGVQVGIMDTLVVASVTRSITVIAPSDSDQPFWLGEKQSSMYDIPDFTIGSPIWSPILRAALLVKGSSEYALKSETGVMHRWVDRVAGERIRPVYVTPVASVIPKSDVLIATGGPQTITVEVEALTDSLQGELVFTIPDSWMLIGASDQDEPRMHALEGSCSSELRLLVRLARNMDRGRFAFVVKPIEGARTEFLRFTFTGPKGTADRTLHEIDYPHIMPQVYYTPAEVKLVPLDVKTTAKRVGYVKGAGDDVPQAMEQLGVTVEFVEPEAAKLEELLKFDAIVVGIRAYNATKGMKELHPLLLQYVEQGGTLVVQYNTTPRFFSGASDFQIDPATLGPHPFTIGRGRVTVEEAPPTFLDPKHPLLNTPNKITAADFEGWVQERGLYFADEFAPHYTPLIAWNDPGEDPLNGALIVADHGKGRFVYTGISFFRQLPAGVGGAYRLWGNLISPRRE